MQRNRVFNFQQEEETFSEKETGLTHPYTDGFVRLRNNGDIEIFAGPGVGLVLNAVNKSITLVADNIKFMTRSGGLRWNTVSFNDRATTFDEPTFISMDYGDTNAGSMLRKLPHFIADDQKSIKVRVDGEDIAIAELAQRFRRDEDDE